MNKKKIYLSIIAILIVLIVACLIKLIYPKFIKTKTNNVIKDQTKNTAMYIDDNNSPVFVDNYDFIFKDESDLGDLLKEFKDAYGFSYNPNREFKILDKNENDGIKYYKVQQLYNDIPVYGNQLVISTKNDKVTSISGHYQKGITLGTYKTLTEDAIKDIISQEYQNFEMFNYEKNIYILDDKTYLTYVVDGCTEVECYKIFIDINTQKIIDSFSSISAAKEPYTYKGKDSLGNDVSIDICYEDTIRGKKYYLENLKYGFRLIDGRNYEQKGNFINALKETILLSKENPAIEMDLKDGTFSYSPFNKNNIESNNRLVEDGIIIMSNLQKTYEFYEKLGRKSVDNRGLKVQVFVDVINENHIFSDDEDFENAFWSLQDDIMAIGRMNGKSFGVALDLIAHEFTHGVIKYTSMFNSKNEPGALHESYADIMGSLVENKNFELGESLGEAIRSMVDPTLYKDPAEYKGKYYFPDDTDTYIEEWIQAILKRYEKNGKPLKDWKDIDQGGTHINSLVPSHAAYLAYANGAFKDKEEMSRVYYNSLLLLTSNATFEDAAYAVIKSAKNLGLSEDKVEIIKNAYLETKILQPTMKIDGQVTDEDGKPLAHVEVRAIYKENEYTYFYTFTDENGNYSFDSLPLGEYMFTYEKGKYSDKAEKVMVNDNITLTNVKMKKVDDKTKDAEIVFVMDTSESMTTNDSKDVRKKMISNIVSQLNDNVRMALVTFTKTASVHNDGINNKTNSKNIVSSVFNITNDDAKNDNSGTNGKAGLTKALSLFTNKDTRKYIIFFTDGEDNKDMPDDLSYDEIISVSKSKKIRILTVGLGNGSSQGVLSNLASGTNGKYYKANYTNKLNFFTDKIIDEIQ